MTLFFRQFYCELFKLFARKRTWMGFAAFLALELIVLILLQSFGDASFRKSFEKNIGFAGVDLVFEDYFRGLTMASVVIGMTMLLLGALFLSLVGGDIVSKEVEDGTLRMTLCRPASRIRVLAVKFAACMVYTIALVFFIGLSAIFVGWLWRGMGGLFVFLPEEKLFVVYESTNGLMRLMGTLPFYALSLCTITSMAFMFSCTGAKPAAATVVTLTVMLIDRVLYMIPHFENLRPWFLTTRISTCLNVLRDPIPWDKMLIDYIYLFGVNATFVIIGCAVFCRRDFKS